jgi:hypothetical protein
MIGKTWIAASLGATLLFSAAGAQASACRDTCNDQSLSCERTGKSHDQCMATWYQCKSKCDAPTLQKTSAPQPPAPKPTPTPKPR